MKQIEKQMQEIKMSRSERAKRDEVVTAPPVFAKRVPKEARGTVCVRGKRSGYAKVVMPVEQKGDGANT